MFTHPVRRKMMRAFPAAVLVLALAASACSGSDGEGQGQRGAPRPNSPDATAGERVLASAFMYTRAPKRVDMLSLDRTSNDIVIGKFRLTNLGPEEWFVATQLSGTHSSESALAGVTLADTKSLRRYFPLHAADGKCVCTVYPDGLRLQPKQSVELFAAFPAPPPGVNRVTVEFPLTPAFFNVPIGSDSTVQLPRGQRPRDPSKLNLRPPKILPLSSTAVALDESKTVREDAENTEILLSADVLFDLNKATLRPKARDILERAAERINNSRAEVVQIDGYTDSTGGPDINVPLSKNRAQAVKQALQKLVTRDVRFDAEGHAADDPVASNATEEGRQQNRRVEITIPKAPPKPQTPTEVPSASAGSASTPATTGVVPRKSPTPRPTVATAEPKNVQDVRAVINAVRPTGNGAAMLYWTLTNTGNQEFETEGAFDRGGELFKADRGRGATFEEYLSYRRSSVSGVSLVDEQSGLRYFPLKDSKSYCVCTFITGFGFTMDELGPGEQITFYDMYALPAGTTSVKVDIPGFKPVNVPVQ